MVGPVNAILLHSASVLMILKDRRWDRRAEGGYFDPINLMLFPNSFEEPGCRSAGYHGETYKVLAPEPAADEHGNPNPLAGQNPQRRTVTVNRYPIPCR